MLRPSCLLLFALLWLNVRAQTRQVLFENVRLEDGNAVVSSFVQAIAEDSAGFIWIGTDHGLVRFDGYQVVSFQNKTADSTTLSDDRVRSIFVDRHGWVWVGTARGISRYAPAARAFKRFECPETGGSDWAVNEIFEDTRGQLWACSNKGVFRFSDDKNAFEKIPLHWSDGTAPSLTNWVAVDRKGQFWGISNSRLVRINPSDGALTPVDLPAQIVGPNPELHRIYFDSKGRMWLAGWPGAIYYEPESGALHRVDLPDSLGYRLTRTVLEDAGGRLIMSFRFDGLAILDPQLNFEAHYTAHPADPLGMTSKRVLAMFIDSRQNLWLGHVKGVQKCRLDDPFAFYQVTPGYSDEHNIIFSINQDGAGGVWLGTAEQGMYSPALGATPIGIPISKQDRPGHTRIKDVNTVFRDRDGSVWLGTGDGMNRGFPGGKLLPVNVDPLFDDLPVFDIVADPDQPDYLWILSAKGLLRLNRNQLRDTAWFYPAPPLQGLFYNKISVDYAGNFWLPLRGGIGYFHRKTGQMSYLFYRQGDPRSTLPGEIICQIADPNGPVLWIGTQNGLSRLDYSRVGTDMAARPDSNLFAWRHYTEAEGLPDDRVQTLTLDGAGRVWFGTYNALCCLDPADNRLRQYPIGNHPIWGIERNIAVWLDQRLAIGGSNGFWLFDPLAVRDDTVSVGLALVDFRVNNQPFSLPTAPELVREIALDHNQNIFTLEWAALLPASPEGLRYSCQLIGYDQNWSPLSPRRQATYTNLPPGVYEFKVRALMPSGVWSASELHIKLIISPAWWQTRWFMALIGLILSVIGYFLWENAQQKRLLKEQKNLAEQNALYKSRFLANVSHEIRTPLNAIVGLNKLLAGTQLDERQNEYVDAIGQSSENLLWLVNDILDQARIESGRYSFAQRDFDLTVILHQLHNTFIYKAKEKKLEFETNCAPDVPSALRGDPLRLYQILANLMSNALKFTRQGFVSLSVSRLPAQEEGTINLLFEVADSGIGIPKERQSEVFESFRRLDDEPAASVQQGAGLGLSITRELVEQQGGSLTLDSSPGEGSVFRVQLQFKPGQSAPTPQAADQLPRLSGLRILLVEDTPFNQLLAVELLKKYIDQVQVDVADNGLVAVEKVQTNVYDLVLMDVKMPVLDGYAATRAIRQLPDPERNRLPVIGLTANAIPEQIVRCREAGMDEVVIKPVEAAELLDKIARFTRHGQS